MVLSCEGYTMFRGSATIFPKNGREPYTVTGDWLFKPEHGCWYCGGSSYPKEIVGDIRPEMDAKELVSELKVRLNAIRAVKETEEMRAWVSTLKV